MAARERLPPWHEHHRLTNGRELLIRPIRPEDADPLRAGFDLLEPAALRGLLSPAPALDAPTAARLARPNPRTEFTLVATDLEGPGDAVIAALAQVRTDPAALEGSFVVLVSRFVAGLGLRRYLLRRVAKWARSRGVATLRGELPHDPAALQLAESLGFLPLAGAGTDLVPIVLELPRR